MPTAGTFHIPVQGGLVVWGEIVSGCGVSAPGKQKQVVSPNSEITLYCKSVCTGERLLPVNQT